MSGGLPLIDLAVLAGYLLVLGGVGLSLSRRADTPAGFVAAGGALPGWVVGLSLFGTFLSSNTFLGVPGKAFASDWGSFVFSLTLPPAAWIAVRWFVPFYRREGHYSAYRHLEERFGRWARIYAVICYLLTQLARVGTILFGVALAVGALTGWSPAAIMVATGLVVTLYTLIGGIEAVIWTDVAQSVVLGLGALLVVVLVLGDMPEGPGQVLEIALEEGKLGLGGFAFDPTRATFWVVLLYGLFINLNNFGIDQSYVQRYHAARSEREAGRSVWLAAWTYLPISLLFFFLGTALFAWYRTHPEMLAGLAAEAGARAGAGQVATPEQLGDHALPHFVVHRLPVGLSGLVIAAIFAAAMSSIDTSLNSSATVIETDLLPPAADDRARMRRLRIGTAIGGVLGTGAAVAMLGVQSILDTWWLLSGVFAGGVLGLFLLGQVAGRTRSGVAGLAVAVGVLVILWMTLSPRLPDTLAALRSPLHANLVIVVGTSTIFVVGLVLQRLVPAGRGRPELPRG